MKKILLILILVVSFSSYSQKKINYNFTINTTFTTNENFGEYDVDSGNTDWSLVVPNAILFRNGFDVELNKTITIGFNIGLDWHPNLAVLAMPYYIDSKFTIAQVDDDKFYVGGGIGKLLKLGEAFEKGKFYKVGIGYHISTEKPYSFILNLDFQQKKIANFENGRLNSLSLGLGMVFL